MRPKVTVSSCFWARVGARACNKAGVEGEAANQGPEGLAADKPRGTDDNTGRREIHTVTVAFMFHRGTTFVT